MNHARPTLGLVVFITALLASFFPARHASAGSGMINFTSKTIDITVNCRFAATGPQLTTLQGKLTQMSHVMWDATEGQLRLGTVTITCNEATLDTSDYWVYVNPLRSHSPVGTNLGVSGQSTGTLGAHTTQAYDRVGGVFGHEFGHLAFGLRDEYPENQTACGGMGPCIDTPDEQNQCLMQQSSGLSWSEFCVSANHDPKRGNNPACHVTPVNADGAPCAANCGEWDVTTLKYERSRQERANAKSCWQTLAATFPALAAPAGLPVVAEPGGFTAPTFTVNCAANSTFVLVLDRSGSMIWSVKKDNGEVCGNGIDDDGDGMIDEASDCAEARMQYVKESAAAILELANDSGISAGIVGFDEFASTVAPIQSIDTHLADLETAADAIAPGGQTAIGRGLDQGKTLLDADPTAAGAKAAIVITDGHNNRGPSPATSADAYHTAGYRIYTIATGEASNDALINDIADNTNGYSVNEPQADELVTAVAEMYAQYRNGGILVPRTPYVIDAGSGGSGTLAPHVGLPQQVIKDFRVPAENRIQFNVEPGMRRFTALLAGNLGNMSGFGVDATLIAPDGSTINAAAPPAGVRVVFRPFFTFVRVQAPMAGLWTLAIRTKSGAASRQTGTMIVISEHPESHLFVNLSRNVVTAAGQTVKVTVLPSYVSGLRDADVKAWLRAPDGTTTTVPITTGEDTRDVYTATLSTFPQHGAYDLIVDMSTTASTTNAPGENHPGEIEGPDLTVPIPPIQRSITRTVYADYGPWVCPPNRDCDGDGIIDESTTSDGDGDHVPASHDPDDNGDNIPDGNQQPPTGNGTKGQNPFAGLSGHRRWWLGGAVGSSHPLGSLNKVADANIYGKIDLSLRLTPAVAARLTGGFAQFTAQTAAGIPHPHYAHVSANVQLLAPFGPASRFFVNGGPGWYRSESGTTSGGLNVGFGWQVDLTAGNVIELGTDYHRVNGDHGRFITWHLGILFH